MKRIISFVIAILMLTCLVSCDKTPKEYDTLTYRFDYDLSDYIVLGQYKGLPAQGFEYTESDEELRNYVNATLAYYSETVEITDRGAKLGDTVYIDYVGTVGGESFTNGSAKNYPLSLGFSTFPEGFEEAITGLVAGDTASLDLTFPTPYETNPELEGKAVHYEVTVNKITAQVLPEYNNEFVKEKLGFDSVEAYENSVRDIFKTRYKAYYYREVLKQVWDVIIENTTVIKYPKKDLQAEYDAYINRTKAYVEHNNMRFEDYVGVYFGFTDLDKFYEHAHKMVEDQMKEDMVCYAIARAENITLTDEEYTKRAEEYALEYYNMDSVEAFEEMYSVEVIREMILFDLVREFVCDHAELTYIQ